MRGMSFAGSSLQSNEIITETSNIFSPSQRKVQVVKLAQRDGGVYNGGNGDLEPKEFFISGLLRRGSTIAETDQLIDYFIYLMSQPQEVFAIDHANGQRHFIATANSPMIARERGLASAGFTVNFVVPDGVGFNVETSALIANGTLGGAASKSFTIMVEGTYKAQPNIRIAYSGVTGGSSKSVIVSNGETSQGLYITRNWAAGDVIDLDCLNENIYVNNAKTDFYGVFPEWEPGSRSLVVMDDFTSRSGTVSATYRKRWL